MDIVLERILSLIPKKENGDFKHGALKEFANTVGLKSGNLISDWINGRSKSYKNYVYEISEKYNVSISWLTGETDIKEKAAPISGSDLPEKDIQFLKKVDLLTNPVMQRLLVAGSLLDAEDLERLADLAEALAKAKAHQ